MQADITDPGAPAPSAPFVTANDQSVANGTSVALSQIYSVTGTGITEYQIWFSAANQGAPALGTVTENGTPIALNQPVTVTNLTGLEYIGSATAGTDEMWLRAFNGTWSGWVQADITDPGFQGASTLAVTVTGTVTSAEMINAGATLELTRADTGSVTFEGSTGTLILDHSSTFNGEIFNFTGNGSVSGSDQIDLKDISYNSVHDSYANGVLTVTDGTNTATLDFHGSYVLANFDFVPDGNGGTLVYDPPVQTTGTTGNDDTGPHRPLMPFITDRQDNTFVFSANFGRAPSVDHARATDPGVFDHAELASIRALGVADHDDWHVAATVTSVVHEPSMPQHADPHHGFII